MDPLTEYMKKTFSDIAERYVDVVCFPLPPSPVGRVIFMPDSFASKNFDGLHFDQDKKWNAGFRPISMTWGAMGIAVFGKVKVASLIGVNENGLLKVSHSTCCATSSALTIARDETYEFVDEVVLDRLSLTARSCHPGSHFSIPDAPYLTALLQWAQSPDGDNMQTRAAWEREIKRAQHSIKYLSPDEGKIYFPTANYSRNRLVDNYISRCCVGHKVSIDRTLAGLGEWSRPYLKKLRRNILELEEFYRGGYQETVSTGTVSPDASEEDGGNAQTNPDVRGNQDTPRTERRQVHAIAGPEASGSVMRLLEIPWSSDSISGV